MPGNGGGSLTYNLLVKEKEGYFPRWGRPSRCLVVLKKKDGPGEESKAFAPYFEKNKRSSHQRGSSTGRGAPEVTLRKSPRVKRANTVAKEKRGA